MRNITLLIKLSSALLNLLFGFAKICLAWTGFLALSSFLCTLGLIYSFDSCLYPAIFMVKLLVYGFIIRDLVWLWHLVLHQLDHRFKDSNLAQKYILIYNLLNATHKSLIITFSFVATNTVRNIVFVSSTFIKSSYC